MDLIFNRRNISTVARLNGKIQASPERKRGRPPVSSPATLDRNSVDRIGVEADYARAKTIFRKGQAADSIYRVESGCVRTYVSHSDGRRLITGFYFPGDYFGLELHKKHRVCAEAIVASKILVVRTNALTSRAANDAAVAKHMLTITGAELRRAQNHSLLLQHSAHERVANFLLEMKQRNRRKEVDLHMSRQDIADHLGLTIETVSRVLNRLKKKSLISRVTRRRVTVHLRKRLAA
jgi:CRP/FNR family nitrogen fixation transcriptional regulator